MLERLLQKLRSDTQLPPGRRDADLVDPQLAWLVGMPVVYGQDEKGKLTTSTALVSIFQQADDEGYAPSTEWDGDPRLPEPEPLEQVEHGRDMPAPAAAGEHAAPVQLRRDIPQAGRAAAADVLDDRRKVAGMPIGVPRDGRPERRTSLASPLLLIRVSLLATSVKRAISVALRCATNPSIAWRCISLPRPLACRAVNGG